MQTDKRKIIDMHCDTIGRLCGSKAEEFAKRGEDLRKNQIHLDLEKMAMSGYTLQTFAMFINKKTMPDPFKAASEMIDYYNQQMQKHNGLVSPVLKYTDLLENEKNGKMSGLLSIEGGEAICGKIEKLHEVYEKGVRLMTLTWNYTNELGHPNMLQNANGEWDLVSRNPAGLTSKGIEVVEKMQKMGMIVDVSHLSDGGFWDVYHHTKKPFVASHSNAAAIQNVCRNLTDDMIRALAERGGVAGLNFCEDFLGDNWSKDPEEKAKEQLEAMVKHVKYLADKGGIEICALGTDFDGIEDSKAIPDASYMERLLDALKKNGFTENQLDAFCHGNVKRVLKEIL